MTKRKNSRAANGAGTIRRRSDGRWEGMYYTGQYDPISGKAVRKSVYGKTQREVRQKMSEISVELDTGTYSEPSKLTVTQWLNIWIETYTSNLKDGTRSMYRGYIDGRILPALGTIRLCELTAPMVQQFYNDLSTGDKPVKPKTVKNIHGILHKALKQAFMLGYIRVNPSDTCTLPRIEKTAVNPFTEQEMKDFIVQIKGERYELLFLFALFTGMRQGEILGLSWRQVDFEQGTILVDQQLRRIDHAFRITEPKNSKSRRITAPQFVMQLLRQQRTVQLECKLAAGEVWSNDNDLAFTNEIGGHLVGVTVYDHFKAVARQIGRPDARFHDLRHTYAVSALRAGDDVKTLQENLGHHTAAFTLDRYGHVIEEMKKASAARMDAFISSLA